MSQRTAGTTGYGRTSNPNISCPDCGGRYRHVESAGSIDRFECLDCGESLKQKPVRIVPKLLRQRHNWICWKEVERDRKTTKIPVSPHNPANRIDATDPDNGTDYETARKTAATHDSVAGIGYIIDPDGRLIAVDLDDCRDPETGEIADWAQEIVDRLDSYTEISPSGTGLHIYVLGSIPDLGNRSGDVEIYDCDRFFTFTGQHVKGTPPEVKERETAIRDVYNEHIGSDRDASNDSQSRTATDESTSTDLDDISPSDSGNSLSDDDVLTKARDARNGEKFKRLWNGDWSTYPSHSEARMALYNLLAFWTAKDEQQMWRLFKDSGLYPHPQERGKCERLQDREIAKAIRDTDDSYTGSPNTESLPEIESEPPTDGGRLTVSDYALKTVLAVLDDDKGMTLAEITSQVDRGKSQVHNTLTELRELGRVDRTKDPFNQRRYRYYRT